MTPKTLASRLFPRKPALAQVTPPVEPAEESSPEQPPTERPKEIGGPAGPEPTRYGDWERNGRCIDF